MSVKIDKKCDNCELKGTYVECMNIYVCKNCKELDKYVLISLTNAKRTYLLTDEEICKIESYKKNHATYFTKHNLEEYACVKYKTTLDNLNIFLAQMVIDKQNVKLLNKQKKDLINIKKQEEQKKQDELKQIELKKQNQQNRRKEQQKPREQREQKKQQRKADLTQQLLNVGLDLRDDSILCKNYIQGDDEHTIDFIVNRMCQMKYLYEYCDMDKYRTIVYDEYNEQRRDGCYPKYSVSEKAEQMALNNCSNGKYPSIYPWQ